MGTASRKTWLEKQADDVQMFVLSMDESGLTLDQMVSALREKYGTEVPRATLGYALKMYHDAIELRAAEDWASQFEKLCDENPHIQAAKLARAFLTQKLASARFRDADLKPSDLVFFSQSERRMDLEERKTAAIERRNELQREKNDLQRRQQEFQEQKWRKALETATGEAKAKLQRGESLTVEDINRIRERTFGLPAVPGEQSGEKSAER
jgi:hypothetical protein